MNQEGNQKTFVPSNDGKCPNDLLKEPMMRTKESKLAVQEQLSLDVERTLRAIDALPREERMARLRELAAGPSPKPTLTLVPTPKRVLADGSAAQQDQKRIIQLKRLCQRYWVSRHTATILSNFVGDRLSKGPKRLMWISDTGSRLSPLQQIVWNVAPFFRRIKKTPTGQAGTIAWEDVVQFLSLVQNLPRRTTKGGGSMKLVKPTSHLRNETKRLRAIYDHIEAMASKTPYAAEIGNLLVRHTRMGNTQ
jgi:hypothetical protein